jgi:hypothetical protein
MVANMTLLAFSLVVVLAAMIEYTPFLVRICA